MRKILRSPNSDYMKLLVPETITNAKNVEKWSLRLTENNTSVIIIL